jgi:hypothetical protein
MHSFQADSYALNTELAAFLIPSFTHELVSLNSDTTLLSVYDYLLSSSNT